MRRLFEIRNRYYGDSSYLNVLVSKSIFWAIGRRRRQLTHRFKNFSPQTATNNPVRLREAIDGYLAQGIDKLNIGGGNKNLEGFVNLDFVFHDNVERALEVDALDLSFIPNNVISQVHSSHFIEHLTQDQLLGQLDSYHRILKPKGLISIRCPNALGVCYGFFFGQFPESGREDFISFGYPKDESFFDERDGWYHKDLFGLYHWLWAYSGNKLNQHLNQITPTKLYSAIESKGFAIKCKTAPEASNIVVVAEKL